MTFVFVVSSAPRLRYTLMSTAPNFITASLPLSALQKLQSSNCPPFSPSFNRFSFLSSSIALSGDQRSHYWQSSSFDGSRSGNLREEPKRVRFGCSDLWSVCDFCWVPSVTSLGRSRSCYGVEIILPKVWASLGSSTAGAEAEARCVVLGAVGFSDCSSSCRIARTRKTRSLSAAGEAVGQEEPGMAAQFSSSEGVVIAADRTRAQNGEKGIRVGAVFFDMDDTLVLTTEIDREAQSVVMALVGVRAPHVDQSAVLRGFSKRFGAEAWDPEHKVEVTEWRARLWGKALEEQGLDDMDLARDLQTCFDKERLQAFRWTTSAELLVRSLHQQGIKVGIITNGHPMVQRAKLKACNAEELFDTILVGGEEPKSKPHRDIFLKACNLAGCKPEEAIMVGDTLKTDIQGAINAGFLSTVWVNVYKMERPCDAAKPDHEIASFSELQQVLEQLGVVFKDSE